MATAACHRRPFFFLSYNKRFESYGGMASLAARIRRKWRKSIVVTVNIREDWQP
jgi:hypothetical protein